MSNNPNAIVIIQARLQSKRLPGKSLLYLCGKTILEHVIERSQKIEHVEKVVIATCKGNEDLLPVIEKCSADHFIGSELNVLERYFQAAEKFGGDYIVRVTGDNPFTDSYYASIALENAIKTESDLFYVTGLPIGAGVEVIKRCALEKAYCESTTDYQKEHVSPYIKENPHIFNIQSIKADVHNPFVELRLTVDTADDYRLACLISNNLYKGHPYGINEIIELIKKDPAILDINKFVKQRSMTHSEK